MLQIRSNQIVCIFGRRGMGKSTLAKKIFTACETGIIFDPLREHGDLGVLINDTKQITQANLDKYKKIVFQPANAEKEAALFFESCMKMYNFMLFVEEVDMVAGTYWVEDNLKNIIRYGRHNAIGVMTVNRRSKELSSIILAQADFIITFRQTRTEDVEYLGKYAEIPSEKIKNLKKFEFVMTEI